MNSTRNLGILARRTTVKRGSLSLHTSAVLLRVGARTISPRARPTGKPRSGEPPIKRAPPLAKPVEKLPLARVHAALLRDIDWWSTRSAFTNATILGIPRLLARDWLELFPSIVREELNTIDLERLDTSPHPEWDLDAIADDIQDDRYFGISRAFMLRFLNFAISQLTSMHSSSHSELLRSLHAIKDATDLRHMTEWYPLARSMRRKIIMHVGPTNSGKTYNALQALASAPSGVYAGPLRLLAHEVWQRINKGSIAPKQQDVETRTEGIVDLDDATPVSVTTERSDSSSPSTPSQTPPQAPVTGYAGRACNLLTGEEQRVVSPNATAVSCTVEMIPKHLIWDVGVIDEIQMLADPHRGGAWTSAVLGLAARELHLCGEDTVVDLVRALCATTGDELIVNRYERLTPLEVAQKSLSGRLKNVERGDCVVTFSRNEIFLTKRKIEDATGLRCAVVYGRLPPEVRSEQAQLFNDEESGYDVIVASDSVGMGLNLKIKRVVFLRTDKWNGKEDVPLPIPLIKQIAGRAGRFGLLKSKGKSTGDTSKPKSVAEIVASQPPGVVTALRNDSLNRVRTALSLPNPKVQHARVDIANPNTEILSQALPPGTNVSDLLETMRLLARLPEHTKLGQPNIELRNNQPSASSAKSLNFDTQRPDDISLDVDLITRNLPLSERLVFASAPVRWRDATARQAAMSFIRAYERKMHVSIRGELKGLGMIEALDDIRKQMSSRAQKKSRKHTKTDDDSEEPEKKLQVKLQMLESLHSTLVLYMWLSYRLPLGFYQASEAQGMKNETERGIEWCLEQIRSMKQKRAATDWEEVEVEVEEEEEEEKPKDQRIQYLNRDALEKWRREGMSPAVWDDLLEKARRAAS